MSDIGTGVATYLNTKSTVTDVCGARINPDVLPQGETLPALVYQIIDGVSHGHTTGKSETAMTRVQITAYAATRIAANNLADQVRLVLDRYSGAAGSETIYKTYVQGLRTSYEPPQSANDNGRYSTSRDYIVWHHEPPPTT